MLTVVVTPSGSKRGCTDATPGDHHLHYLHHNSCTKACDHIPLLRPLSTPRHAAPHSMHMFMPLHASLPPASTCVVRHALSEHNFLKHACAHPFAFHTRCTVCTGMHTHQHAMHKPVLVHRLIITAHGHRLDAARLAEGATARQPGLAHDWLQLGVPLRAFRGVINPCSKTSGLCQDEKRVINGVNTLNSTAPAKSWLLVRLRTVGGGGECLASLAALEVPRAVCVLLCWAYPAARGACTTATVKDSSMHDKWMCCPSPAAHAVCI